MLGDTTKRYKVGAMFSSQILVLGNSEAGCKRYLKQLPREKPGSDSSLVFYTDPFLYMTHGGHETEKALLQTTLTQFTER